MASPTVAASPSRAGPADILTAAPSPASPPRRLASTPPAVDASGSGSSSPASAHSGDQLSTPDASSSPLLASRSEEYRLLFRLPPDEVLVQDFNCALQENILLQPRSIIRDALTIGFPCWKYADQKHAAADLTRKFSKQWCL